MRRWILCALALLATCAIAATDWQDQSTTAVREEWRFRDAEGHVTIANDYRAYLVGADSALAANQIDFVAAVDCSCYYATNMRSGARIRSGRFDIWRIWPGTDTRVYKNAYVNGAVIGKGAVDDTTLAAGAVKDTTKIASAAVALSALKTTTAAVAGDVLSATGTGGMDWHPLADTQLPATITIGTGESIDVSGTGRIHATHTVIEARSTSGTLPVGSVVYIVSYNVGGWCEVALADANESDKMPAVGVCSVALGTGASGHVVTNGVVRNIATTGLGVGSKVYVSGTAGGLTATRPAAAGDVVQKIGICLLDSPTVGELLVVGSGRSNDNPNLEAAKFWVGSATNAATAVAMSGAATMANTGAVTLAANAVADSAKVALAAVPLSRLALTGARHATYSNLRIDTASQRLYAGPDSVGAGGAADTTTLTTHTEDSNLRFKGTLVQTGLLTANGGLTVAGTVTLPTDAVQSSAIDWGDVMNGIRTRPYCWAEFMTAQNATMAYSTEPWWYSGAISSGDVIGGTNTSSHPGVAVLRCASGANSGYQIMSDQGTNGMILGGGEASDVILKQVATTRATSRYITRFGYHNSTTYAAPTDGAYLQIAGTTTVDSLIVKGRSAKGSTQDSTSTSYTITAGTWYRFRVIVNAGATRADFYIYNDSGAQLWTDYVSAQIPTTVVGNGIVVTNSGTVAASMMNIDYMARWYDGRSLAR